MKILKYKVIGNSPLLMHSDVTANPLNKFTKRLKEFTGKRKKTDEDYHKIAEIEFEAGVYWNDKIGYFMPAINIDASLVASAKQFKLGTTWKQAALVPDDSPFIFKHKNVLPVDLFKMEIYSDFRTVKIGTSKNVRCRPIFPKWEFDMEIYVDEAKLNEAEVDQIMVNAGKYIGLCDYRPRFGRFDVEKIS